MINKGTTSTTSTSKIDSKANNIDDILGTDSQGNDKSNENNAESTSKLFLILIGSVFFLLF